MDLVQGDADSRDMGVDAIPIKSVIIPCYSIRE